MGHLKEKYTEEYFTGVDKNGTKLNYGATSSLDDNGIYTLRAHDKKILEKINFNDKNILALGCGRGEELAYAIENGANPTNTVGVDFSPSAIKICKKIIKSRRLSSPQLYVEDALVFVSNFGKGADKNKSKKFDVVIMFDFVEHVPRDELSSIVCELKRITKNDSILVINTPAYKYDNDVIRNGYDERNYIGIFDTSDDRPETKGMHCNKYSVVSLQEFMLKNGYCNITEAHYYIRLDLVSKDFQNMSYFDRWVKAEEKGLPIINGYSDDDLEYPYGDRNDLRLIKFNSGNLRDISIITTESYKDIAYPGGNTDPEMMDCIESMGPSGKIIFDVGTFVGVCSMLFSKMVGKGGKVFGFEPNPSNINRTFLNLSHNPDISNRILIFKCAFGAENKNQNMFLSQLIDNGYSSTSRLEGSHSTIHDLDLPDGFGNVEVKVETLDSFVREVNVIPDILKVDIEGAEYDFLLGALKTIRKRHPTFYIELHSQYCAAKCTELLVLEGYSIKVLREEEDNRVMILAKYTGDSLNKVNVAALKSANDNFSVLRKIADSLETLNKEINIKDNHLANLVDENKKEKERVRIIESANEVLSNRINAIENSRSWIITRPIRNFKYIINSKR